MLNFNLPSAWIYKVKCEDEIASSSIFLSPSSDYKVSDAVFFYDESSKMIIKEGTVAETTFSNSKVVFFFDILKTPLLSCRSLQNNGFNLDFAKGNSIKISNQQYIYLKTIFRSFHK